MTDESMESFLENPYIGRQDWPQVSRRLAVLLA